MMDEQMVRKFVFSLCHYAGEKENFGEEFLENLKQDTEIYEEFLSYMQTGNFACKAKVCGYTVVDIMVWQMDHFKARLDRDNTGTRQNGDRMLLLAFDTLLKMKREPESYLFKLKSETGTDFEGKY